MFRIALFLATNIAVLALISFIFSIFGFQGLLQSNGVDLDLQALLIFSAIIGFSGSLISLLLSKTMAKMSMGVKIITKPASEYERWLMTIVERQARQANIGMPEMGIFPGAPNAFATGWNKHKALVAVCNPASRRKCLMNWPHSASTPARYRPCSPATRHWPNALKLWKTHAESTGTHTWGLGWLLPRRLLDSDFDYTLPDRQFDELGSA
ncbi:MAG: hypothetical protein WD601_00805 [Pseudohongiellaceae bacterium]